MHQEWGKKFEIRFSIKLNIEKTLFLSSFPLFYKDKYPMSHYSEEVLS